ncbi:MAG: hypothetical protein ACQETL_09850 [Bacteroidota bacterium]
MKYLKLILTSLFIFSSISCSEDKTSTELERTLEAETEAGSLQAERDENSYVGSLGDERAIGISYHHNVKIIVMSR